MKKYILFLLLVYSGVLNAQSEFKISIDHTRWENPTSTKVTITIFLTIKNIGNEKGKCEDLHDLYLDCSYPYSYDNIKVLDNSNNILNIINPGLSVESYIIFEVPKDADNLTLRFYGGASKFISESYNKWLNNQKEDKFELFVSEGDLRMIQNYPEEAVTQYKSALEVSMDKSKKDEVRKKLSAAYEKIADNYVSAKIWGLAVDNYLLAIESNLSYGLKDKIAEVYKNIGDEGFTLGSQKEAIRNYELSLKYKEDTQIRKRLNELLASTNKKQRKDEKARKSQIEYQQLLNPKVGFRLGGGLSFQNKDGSKNGGTFWTAGLGIIPKLFVGESSPFAIGINTELNVSGLITNTSNKNFTDYYNLNDSILSTESALSNEYSVNIGIGLAFLSKSFTPLFLINYGVYALNIKYSIRDVGTIYSRSSSVDALYWGHGPKIELNFVFSRKFYLGYSFKSYSISADKFIDFEGSYSGHTLNAGLMLF